MTFAYPVPNHETIGTERLQRLGWGDLLLWAFALAVVVSTLAAAGAVAATWHSEPELPGAPPPAIMIELAEISVAPQVEDLAVEDGEISMEQAPAPTAEPIDAIVPEPISELPAEKVEELKATVSETAIEPEPTMDPAVEEPIEELIPDLVEAETDVAVPMPVVMPAAITRQRERFAEQQERDRMERDKRRQQQQAQQAQAASPQTAPRSVEAENSPRAAALQQTTTTRRLPNVSPQQWQSQVIAHLNRAKRYPSDARSRREEGVPHLQFAIDQAGKVLSARIVRSSGFPALDQAALDMINRASPVPVPPASTTETRITLTVPVNFNLR